MHAVSCAGVTALRTTELVQGKTSRWAIAWSFAASPNTASMPLPRRTMPQQQRQQHQHQHQQTNSAQQQRSKRPAGSAAGATKLSLRVTAPAAEGRRLLQALAALLTRVGQAQGVHVDTLAWKVSCQLAVGSGQQQQQQQQHTVHHLGEAGAGTPGQAPAAKHARAGNSGAACGGDAAAPAAAVSSAVRCSAVGDVAAAYAAVEVSVFQQQRGSFEVVAAVKGQLVGQQQQQLAAVAMQQVFEAVREDLTLMWPVGPLQLL
jgi:hypothetical protein